MITPCRGSRAFIQKNWCVKIHSEVQTIQRRIRTHSKFVITRKYGDQLRRNIYISPEMIKHYSHIRRQALNAAAAVLEPTFLKPQTTSAEMVN